MTCDVGNEMYVSSPPLPSQSRTGCFGGLRFLFQFRGRRYAKVVKKRRLPTVAGDGGQLSLRFLGLSIPISELET